MGEIAQIEVSSETTFNENTVTYLQMIQNNIDRMSTSSALFKGFAATIVSGISALSFSEINNCILIISVIPVLSFMFLDIYYLQLERRYRYLYERIRTGSVDSLFSLSLKKLDKDEKKKAKVKWYQLLSSPSFYLFYPILIIISIIVVTMKLLGILV